MVALLENQVLNTTYSRENHCEDILTTFVAWMCAMPQDYEEYISKQLHRFLPWLAPRAYQR